MDTVAILIEGTKWSENAAENETIKEFLRHRGTLTASQFLEAKKPATRERPMLGILLESTKYRLMDLVLKYKTSCTRKPFNDYFILGPDLGLIITVEGVAVKGSLRNDRQGFHSIILNALDV